MREFDHPEIGHVLTHEEWRRAAKDYPCCQCSAVIRKGTRHLVRTEAVDGSWGRWRMHHEHCWEFDLVEEQREAQAMADWWAQADEAEVVGDPTSVG